MLGRQVAGERRVRGAKRPGLMAAIMKGVFFRDAPTERWMMEGVGKEKAEGEKEENSLMSRIVTQTWTRKKRQKSSWRG